MRKTRTFLQEAEKLVSSTKKVRCNRLENNVKFFKRTKFLPITGKVSLQIRNQPSLKISRSIYFPSEIDIPI
jgi:hypothetical protein